MNCDSAYDTYISIRDLFYNACKTPNLINDNATTCFKPNIFSSFLKCASGELLCLTFKNIGFHNYVGIQQLEEGRSSIAINSKNLNVDREYVKGSWLQGILFLLVSSGFPRLTTRVLD